MGSKGSGKSSIISSLIYGDFSITPAKPLLKKTITKDVNGKKVIIDILFQEANENYEKQILNSTAIILVVDITDEKSYNYAKSILPEINSQKKSPIFLVANKLDLKYEAVIW
ncbi:MAG: GTPase domain-containing protein, partial [Thermoplasmata archaeon]